MVDFPADVLTPLVHQRDLDRDTARDALAAVLAGTVSDVHLASFLTALTVKGSTSEEMTGFVDAMMGAARQISVRADAVDIVGTGGDHQNSVNVSTMASFAVAGCGVPVAKHGNRAASGNVGSADVLEALGVRLDADPATAATCLDHAGMTFLFAPIYHHALGRLTPVRRELGFRTVFNTLGPLANPARVRRAVIGVADLGLLERMADVLAARGVDHVALVFGTEGLDELSLGAPSVIHHVTAEGRRVEEVDAAAVLGRHHRVDDIRGGDVATNVRAVRSFLDATPGPVFDVACANAALALVVAGRATDLTDGFVQAAESVRSGRAAAALAALVEHSNSVEPA